MLKCIYTDETYLKVHPPSSDERSMSVKVAPGTEEIGLFQQSLTLLVGKICYFLLQPVTSLIIVLSTFPCLHGLDKKQCIKKI